MNQPERARRRKLAPTVEDLRLLGRVARMYHERGLRQPQIAKELGLSQARVSRLLRQAEELGVVRTVVTLPEGVHTDLEDEIRDRFGLRDVVVVDTSGTDDDVIPALGTSAAAYLDVSLVGGHVIGVSSWSETLLSAVRQLPMKRSATARWVVQLVGGLGNRDVQIEATRLTSDFAERTGAEPAFLPAPGLVDSPAVRRALMKDRSVADVRARWQELSDVVVGIGSLAPSPLLIRSGNAIAGGDQEALRALGAVGDVCFRFFDAEGQHIKSALDRRVIGIDASQLQAVPRRIGVAGGERKFTAIRAALLGGWVNVLITDLSTARRLTEEPRRARASLRP